MMRTIIILILIVSCFISFSQQPGTLDQTFGNNGSVFTDFNNKNNSATKVLIQDDGKIIVCGTSGSIGEDMHGCVVRYNPDGSYDMGFANSGKLIFSYGGDVSQAKDMALQPDGKILVTGFSDNGPTYNMATYRFLENGITDLDFGVGGVATTDFGHDEYASAVTIQDDGKILVTGHVIYGAGADIDMFVCRYNSDGSVDLSFGTNGHVITDLNVESEDMPGDITMHMDKILVSAYAYDGNSSDYDAVALAQYDLNGVLDPNFGSSGISLFQGITISNFWLSAGTSMALDAYNRIVVASHVIGIESTDFAMFRFAENGIPDNTFGDYGLVITDMTNDNAAYSTVIQPDGKILAGGYHINGGYFDHCIVRYLENGDLDTDFGVDGISNINLTQNMTDDVAYSLALQTNGYLIAAGMATNDDYNRDFSVARIHTGLPTGIHEQNNNNTGFTIQPNPTNGIFSIETTIPLSEIKSIIIYDLTGKIVYQKEQVSAYSFNLDFLDGGVYMLALKYQEGICFQKIIIE